VCKHANDLLKSILIYLLFSYLQLYNTHMSIIVVLTSVTIYILFYFLSDSTTRSPPRDRKDRNHKGKGRKKDKKKKGNG